MFVEVPEPVSKMSSGKWSSSFPSITSSAAAMTPWAGRASNNPSSLFAFAAAHLIRPSASMNRRGNRRPDTGKFSTARCVCAPQYASAGTRTSPMESFSTRNSLTRSSLVRRKRANATERAPEVALLSDGRLARMLDFAWKPSSEYIEHANVTRLMRRHGIADYPELIRRSQDDIEWFWQAVVEDLDIE